MAAHSGLLSVSILLNLIAALDTVSHSILLHGLISIGTTHTSLTGLNPIFLTALNSFPFFLFQVFLYHWCDSGLCPGDPLLTLVTLVVAERSSQHTLQLCGALFIKRLVLNLTAEVCCIWLQCLNK